MTIDWADKTKSSKVNPFRASGFVVIESPWALPILYNMISQLRKKGPADAHITTCSTKQFDALMSKLKLPWSGHSMKKGAANVVVQAAARGEVSIFLLPVLLKHTTTSELQSKTIRYIDDKVALARALGTQDATRLL